MDVSHQQQHYHMNGGAGTGPHENGGGGGEHPVFSQPIVNGDQCIGGTINIDFQVKGFPEPQLQWFKNNQLLNLGGRINLFGGIEGWYTLQIKDLCIEDQGEYTFIADNEYGEATCVVNLQDVGFEHNPVGAGNGPPGGNPMFGGGQPPFSHPHHQDSALSPSSHGPHLGPGSQGHGQGHPLAYQPPPRSSGMISSSSVPLNPNPNSQGPPGVGGSGWHKDFSPDVRVSRIAEVSGSNTALSRRDNIAPYAVPGLGRNPDTVDEGERAYQPPVFYGQPQVRGDLKEGGKLVIDIKLAAHPEPRIHWFKNGRPGIFSERIRLERGMHETYKLVIKNLREDDEGEYCFVAENYLGRNARTIFIGNIEVPGKPRKGEPQVVLVPQKDPPLMTTPRIIGEVKPGNEVHVEFEIHSEEKPNVKLFHDGILINLQGPRIFLRPEPNSKYVLTFRDLNAADEGGYRITAENSNGSNFTTFNLQGLKDPPKPKPVARPWKSVSPPRAPTPPVVSQINIEAADPPIAPKFSEPIITGDMYIGGNLHIDFTLTGRPEPSVKWFKNGQEIFLGHRLQLDRKVGNNYSLVLPNIQVTDEGEYEFFAENAIGEAVCVLQLTPLPRPPSPEYIPPVSHVSVKETTSFRRHQEPPKFSKPEVTGDMIVGGTVNVFFHIRGVPNPDVLFFKNGLPMNFNSRVSITKGYDESYTLTIRGIRYDDEAEYMIKASNPVGEAKCTITLTIERAPRSSYPFYDMVPPKFAEPIKTRFEGDVAYLEGYVTGSPKPTISWWKDGHEIRHDHNYSHTTSYDGRISLRINNIYDIRDGEIVCKAVNNAGIASCSVHFQSQSHRIGDPPSFTQPIIPTIDGNTAVLDCIVHGNPPPNILWYKDGHLLHHGGNFEIYTSADGSTSLVIHNFKNLGPAEYVCKATSIAGEISCSLKLIIERRSVSASPSRSHSPNSSSMHRRSPFFYSPSATETTFHRVPPKFTKQVTPQVDGKYARFTCRVTGQPKPNITWYRNKVPVFPGPDFAVQEDPDGTCTLIVYDVDRFGNCEYQCLAENEGGIATSTIEFVTNTGKPPKIIRQLTPVIDGNVGTFTCQVTGDPMPDVVWLRNGEEIRSGGDFVIHNGRNGECSLTIYNVTEHGNSEYTCRATNPSGTSSTTVELVLQRISKPGNPPKFIQTMKPSIDGVTAKFECVIDGKPRPEVSWLKNGIEVMNGGNFHIVHGLDGYCCLTIYDIYECGPKTEFVCKATNSSGITSCCVTLVLEESVRFEGGHVY